MARYKAMFKIFYYDPEVSRNSETTVFASTLKEAQERFKRRKPAAVIQWVNCF